VAQVLYSKTEAEFEQNWARLRADYTDQPSLLSYLETKQYPQRQECVQAWTSRVRHFGITVTSRLESYHGLMKTFLQGSHGNLLSIFNAIRLLVQVSTHELLSAMSKARDRVPYHVNAKLIPVLHDDLNSLITPQAIELVLQQWRLARDGGLEAACLGQFSRIYRLPCRHSIARMLQIDKEAKIRMQHIHPHWWFKRPFGYTIELPPPPEPSQPAILEPQVIRGRGRPRDRSTRRAPSHFELEPPARSQHPATSQNDASGNPASTTPPGTPPGTVPEGPRSTSRGRGRGQHRWRGRGRGRGSTGTQQQVWLNTMILIK
jgi:hypothetical protein